MSITITDRIRHNPDKLRAKLTLRFTVDPASGGANAAMTEQGRLKAIAIALFGNSYRERFSLDQLVSK